MYFNQKISNEIIFLFSKTYIYTNYIATKEKRKELESIYEKNSKIKYNPDNLFKRGSTQISKDTNENSTIINASTEIPTVVIEKKWYQKLFDKFKNIFKNFGAKHFYIVCCEAREKYVIDLGC